MDDEVGRATWCVVRWTVHRSQGPYLVG